MKQPKGFYRRTAWKIRKHRLIARVIATIQFHTTFEIDKALINELLMLAGQDPLPSEGDEVRAHEFVQCKLKEAGFN